MINASTNTRYPTSFIHKVAHPSIESKKPLHSSLPTAQHQRTPISPRKSDPFLLPLKSSLSHRPSPPHPPPDWRGKPKTVVEPASQPRPPPHHTPKVHNNRSARGARPPFEIVSPSSNLRPLRSLCPPPSLAFTKSYEYVWHGARNR